MWYYCALHLCMFTIFVCCWNLPLDCRSYHCQRAHLIGGRDQGDSAQWQQQRPGLSLWVWDVWYLLFCSKRSGEHYGWWGDQAVFRWGVGVLESANAQQQQLPLHQPEADGPMGAGSTDPLWLPASSQVLNCHNNVVATEALKENQNLILTLTCFIVSKSNVLKDLRMQVWVKIQNLSAVMQHCFRLSQCYV